QLRAFKAKTRGEKEAHDYMWGMATLLEDPVIDALAAYYAQQKPGAGIPGDPALMAQGKKLFDNGDPSREIQACAACHGATAQGVAIFPRLAGQHQAYLMHQIELIQNNLRESSIMHGVVKDLKPEDIKAITSYLQSL
ncbi:MAG: c-type cytochrome, partial [Paucibacter sp.]|nr:c-type cytochrome [Roseateles sp.]